MNKTILETITPSKLSKIVGYAVHISIDITCRMENF